MNKNEIRTSISTILSKHMKNYNIKYKRRAYNDIILSNFIKDNDILFQKTSRIKFIQMKIGLVWQSVLGTLPGVTDLGIGHPSSLDLKFTNLQGDKYIIELKNSYNTDNSSSRAMNIQKLGKYVSIHKNYVPIYGIINGINSKGEDKIISYSDIHVRMLSGNLFFKFIFQDESYINTYISILSEEINAFLMDSPM